MVLERAGQHIKYKSRFLDNIPCGVSYPSCKFIKDAHVAIAKLPESEGSLGKAKEEINRFKAEVDKLDSKNEEIEFLENRNEIQKLVESLEKVKNKDKQNSEI